MQSTPSTSAQTAARQAHIPPQGTSVNIASPNAHLSQNLLLNGSNNWMLNINTSNAQVYPFQDASAFSFSSMRSPSDTMANLKFIELPSNILRTDEGTSQYINQISNSFTP